MAQWLKLFLFVVTLIGSGALEIEDRCDPSRGSYNTQDRGEFDYSRCDARKGLFCNEYSRCSCYVTDSYYDYHYVRCIAKVGHPCKASHTFTIPCGVNAECPYDTGFCQCRHGYFPTYDGRACTNGGKLVTFDLLTLTISVFTLLFLQFKVL